MSSHAHANAGNTSSTIACQITLIPAGACGSSTRLAALPVGRGSRFQWQMVISFRSNESRLAEAQTAEVLRPTSVRPQSSGRQMGDQR